MAVDRVVDRSARLDLLPGRILCADARRQRAVTSHDVLQLLRFEPPRKRDLLGRVFDPADLILSVSHFNTDRLLEAFPTCQDRVAYVPNGADDLFFETAADHERTGSARTWGCPPDSLSTLGGELPAAEEPRPADPGGGAAAGGGARATWQSS